MQIRQLSAEDAAFYQEVRLRALREHPEAFATSVAEAAARPLEEIARRVASSDHHVTFGALEQDQLVAIATLVRSEKTKVRHRATLAAMYVAPEVRGRSLGQRLLEQVLVLAREWGVSDVSLAVTVGNHEARHLYESAGFISYGVEPRSLLVDGTFYDTEWMNLQLL